VSLPLPRIEAPAGTARRSATEYLAFGKCPRRHWFKYSLGLREPAVEADAPAWGGPLARGSIIHELLELAAENADADSVLDVTIGRWDPDAPPRDSVQGAAYRAELREEVDRVLADERYAGLAAAPGARRELSFFHVVDESLVLQGAIDLAAPVGSALRLLDVKTGNVDRAEAHRRAEGYGVQREVYVAAAEALSGLPVEEFAFHFSGPGEHVAVPITDELRRGAVERIRSAAAAMQAPEAALTELPYLCYRCGYRKVRWCPGVSSPSPG
jgi:CRISPR/Cas system-associated exonuclease Cas4 (RecB family)